MHKLVIPRKSGIHRFACLALYRALLRQCGRLSSAVPELSSPKSLIQDRFHRYKSLDSPSQTTHALKAGYEAFNLLHSASRGIQRDIRQIKTLVSKTQKIKEQKAARTKQLEVAYAKSAKLPKKEPKDARKQIPPPHPDIQPILSRPRLVISGKRHVPKLVNARGLPFLRIKKPQPPILSAILKMKHKIRWNRIERRDRLSLEMLFAADEDYWDILTNFKEEETWHSTVKEAFSEVKTQIHDSDAKTKELAESMWKVILDERELAEQEQQRSVSDT